MQRNNAIKWDDIPIAQIYRIEKVNDVTVNRDGADYIAKIAELSNDKRTVCNVWLPSLVQR